MGDSQFGPYRLETLLGSGGTGQVWRAHDTRTDRAVALKILARELGADDVYRQRFQREAHAAARLREPHVVPIHTFGEHDGRLYIDMAYIEGSDLAALLHNRGPLSPETAVDIISQAAAALDEAHRHGLLHRDVKPANIVVTPSGFVYLIDFGTAQQSGQNALTGTGNIIGTPAYMAPERFTGSATAGSDIYSLGCVLHECLTGHRVFGTTDPARQMHAHLHDDPPRTTIENPAVPAELDEVVARALAKDPRRHYSHAGEFANDARTALSHANTSITTAMAPLAKVGDAFAATAPLVAVAGTRPITEAVAAESAPAAASSTPREPEHGRLERTRGIPRRYTAVAALGAVAAGVCGAVLLNHANSATEPGPTRQPQPAASTEPQPPAADGSISPTYSESARSSNPQPPPPTSAPADTPEAPTATTTVAVPFPIPALPVPSPKDEKPGHGNGNGNGNGGNGNGHGNKPR